ncbi:MAG TPA: hypothetical protein VK808_00745 [Bacteroidia bacterium]|nr:hypothetical protein [Bacteroidia bacterium]
MKSTTKPTTLKPSSPPSKFNQWLPHIAAIIIFALVGIAYFFPALKGMVLSQSDITQFLGSSHEIIDFRAKYHTEPLWTNTNFAGMPAYPISVAYPNNLVQYIFIILLKWLPFPCGLFFLFCIGFYILLRVLDVNPWVAIISSLAYGFSSYFFIILAVGHNSKADAIAFMAPVLAGVILAFKGKRLQGAILTGIALALELYSDHPQITYYLFMMVLIYGALEFFKAIREKLLPAYFKTVAILGIAAFVAVGTDITNLWLTYDYGKYSTRGKSELTLNGENKTAGLTVSYATQWSYGVPETFSFLIPNYQGGGDKSLGADKDALKDIDPQYRENVANFDQYWGDQPGTSGPVYVGAIICFFAFLGLFIIKGPLKWFVFISTTLSVMLSWGHNFQSFTDLFFEYFPGYSKFRSVSMILVMAELALPLLAALAIDKIFKSKKFLEDKIPVFGKKELLGRNIFLSSLIIVGGFTVLSFIMPTVFTSMQKTDEVNQKLEEIQEQAGQQLPPGELKQYRETIETLMPYVVQARKKVFTADAARSSIFIILAALLAWLYMKKIIDWKWFTAVMGVFILADMFPLDKRYLSDNNFKVKHPTNEEFQPDAADQEIMKDTTLDYRVINTTMALDQDGITCYYHKSLGGYSGAKMKRYNELMTYHIDRELRGIYQALQGQPAYLSVLNMLNTKYAIVEVKGGQKVAAPVPGALGNAWFVDNYRKVNNADSEIVALNNFSPGNTAIVDKRYSDYLKVSPMQPHDSTAVIKMTSYEPNDLNYVSHSKTDRLAVFSEIYYKENGWQAYIDGQPADHIQVDYVLRAMIIPAGNHSIEFKFHPSHYFIGEKISLASSLILFGGCIGFLYMQVKKKKEAA